MARPPRQSPSRGRSRGNTGTRRKRVWITFEDSSVVLTAATGIQADMLDNLRAELGTNALPGITVVRIIGHWYMFDVSVLSGGLQDARVGIIPGVTQQTAVSTPRAYDDEGDFMFVDDIFNIWGETSPDVASIERKIDVKAMRKIDEIDSTLLWVAHNAGTEAIQIAVRVRMLLLLP